MRLGGPGDTRESVVAHRVLVRIVLRILSQCWPKMAGHEEMTLCRRGFPPHAYPPDAKGITLRRVAPE